MAKHDCITSKATHAPKKSKHAYVCVAISLSTALATVRQKKGKKGSQ